MLLHCSGTAADRFDGSLEFIRSLTPAAANNKKSGPGETGTVFHNWGG